MENTPYAGATATDAEEASGPAQDTGRPAQKAPDPFGEACAWASAHPVYTAVGAFLIGWMCGHRHHR